MSVRMSSGYGWLGCAAPGWRLRQRDLVNGRRGGRRAGPGQFAVAVCPRRVLFADRTASRVMSGLPPGGWGLRRARPRVRCLVHRPGRRSSRGNSGRAGLDARRADRARVNRGLLLPGHLPDPSAGGELVDRAFGPDRWPHARWPGRRGPKWGPPPQIWELLPIPAWWRPSYGHTAGGRGQSDVSGGCMAPLEG
jgi:hypothetical protein